MIRRVIQIFAFCWGSLSALAVQAVELSLPNGARMTVERATRLDTFDAPMAGFDGQRVPSITIEGNVTRQIWRIGTAGLTPLQIMVPLRDQLTELGFDVAFECSNAACGGFDFRFEIEVLPGPNMYVNIGSYRYLTVLKGETGDPSGAIGVLVSTTAAAAYVQIIEAGADTGSLVVDVPEPVTATVGPAPNLEQPVTVVDDVSSLLSRGSILLGDLEFASGSTQLGSGPFASLEQLAELLEANPSLRVALVGHTDAVGGLQTNITVSRRRAQSARARLIEAYGVNPNRVDAEGMGYLAPVAPNLTPEGRRENRRVEAVLLNTQ